MFFGSVVVSCLALASRLPRAFSRGGAGPHSRTVFSRHQTMRGGLRCSVARRRVFVCPAVSCVCAPALFSLSRLQRYDKGFGTTKRNAKLFRPKFCKNNTPTPPRRARRADSEIFVACRKNGKRSRRAGNASRCAQNASRCAREMVERTKKCAHTRISKSSHKLCPRD